MRVLPRILLPAVLLCLALAAPAAAEKLPAYPAVDVGLLAGRTNVARVDDLIRNGKYLYKSMRYDDARRFLSDATNRAARVGYETAFLDAANTTALLLLETGRTNDSRELLARLFTKSFTLKKKNLQIISDLLNNLSLVEILQGRPAEPVLQQLKRAARINKDPVKAMVIENNRSLLLIRTGLAAKAIPALRSMTLKAERKGYYEPLVLGLLRIAEARLWQKDHKAAERALHQALDRAVFWEYKRGMTLVLRSLSDFYAEQGDTARALEYARALLSTHESMNAAGLLEADRARIKRLESPPPGPR
jgi:hypothetical protein